MGLIGKVSACSYDQEISFLTGIQEMERKKLVSKGNKHPSAFAKSRLDAFFAQLVPTKALIKTADTFAMISTSIYCIVSIFCFKRF